MPSTVVRTIEAKSFIICQAYRCLAVRIDRRRLACQDRAEGEGVCCAKVAASLADAVAVKSFTVG
jgi:hypothetical protein